MEVTQAQLDVAKEDGAILEAKIAELVEEFESKHAPIQISVLTRHRTPFDRYSLSKGGAAQIRYHDHLPLRADRTKHTILEFGFTGGPDIPMVCD